ncbi:MAG: hypothetical protein ABIR08_01130 [Sphingomonas sp.]
MIKLHGIERRLADIVRLCREQAEFLRTVDPNDIPLSNRMAYFAHIEDRSGETYVEVGMDARIKIQEWCFEHLTRRRWTHLISVSQCAERVQEEIAFRFFKTPQPVDTRTISRIVDALDKSILADVKPHRYFWACHICYGDSPSEFSIGGVRFRPTPQCSFEIDAGLASWSPKIEVSFAKRIKAFYRTFGWIADVTVETSDEDAAKRMSLLAVQVALTALKLLLSNGGAESRIRVSEQQNYLMDSAELYFIGEQAHLTWRQRGGQAPFAPTWWETLNQGDNAYRLRALDAIVRAVTHPIEQTFFKQKYLSALRWFNDATADTYAGSRIAKFVIVLEALVGWNEREDLAETVADRTAHFVAGYPNEGSPTEIKAKVKRIYAVRSELVHGVRDPLGLDLGRIAVDAAHIAHMTLVAFLDWLIFLGIDRQDYDHAKLASNFAIIKANVQRAHAVS